MMRQRTPKNRGKQWAFGYLLGAGVLIASVGVSVAQPGWLGLDDPVAAESEDHLSPPVSPPITTPGGTTTTTPVGPPPHAPGGPPATTPVGPPPHAPVRPPLSAPVGPPGWHGGW